MSAAVIAFSKGQVSGYEELSGANPTFINARVFEDGSIRSRPGIAAWSAFPSSTPSAGFAIQEMALYNGNVIFVCTDRRIFALTPAGVVLDLSTGGALTKLAGDLPPRIAVSGDLCVIVGGGAPQLIDTALVSGRLPGSPDSPPDAIDVCILTRRIVLVRKDTGKFYWSGVLPLGYNVWDGIIEFREAEARADNLVAGRDTTREFWAFGTDTTQIFDPDPVETFTPIVAVDVGCIARKSVITYEGMMVWLDDRRQVRSSTGRTIGTESIISGAISTTLQGLSTVDDCWAFRAHIGASDTLHFVFPTEGRTFVYMPGPKVWGEYRGFSTGTWAAWKPTAFLYWADRNLFLVGLPDGTIAQLSEDAHTDLGLPISWVARSGFDNCGEPTPKDPVETQLVIRRGEADSATSKFRYRWRDEMGPFCQPIDIALGRTGTFDPTVSIRPCGQPFHGRQHEISSTAAEAFVMARATVIYDEMEA